MRAFYILIYKTFTSKPRWSDPNMCASSSWISHKNSLRNTTLHKQPKMAGYILWSSVVATAYRNQADLPMTSCAPVFRRRYITKPPQHLASGAISGVPSNFFTCWRLRHQICGKRIRLPSPQDSRLELRGQHRLGRKKNCRNWPRLGLQRQTRQSDLPHIHGWVHYKGATQIWTLLPQQSATLIAQTLWGDLWRKRKINPRRRHKFASGQTSHKTRLGHRRRTLILCSSRGQQVTCQPYLHWITAGRFNATHQKGHQSDTWLLRYIPRRWNSLLGGLLRFEKNLFWKIKK